KHYTVEILKKAQETPTFLFSNQNQSQPPVGKILLLKRTGESVMAVRVLRSDSDNKRFVGRAIKFYGAGKPPAVGQTLTVVAKAGDARPGPEAAPPTEPPTQEAPPPPPAAAEPELEPAPVNQPAPVQTPAPVAEPPAPEPAPPPPKPAPAPEAAPA